MGNGEKKNVGKEIKAADRVTGTTIRRKNRIKAGTDWAGREAGKPLIGNDDDV